MGTATFKFTVENKTGIENLMVQVGPSRTDPLSTTHGTTSVQFEVPMDSLSYGINVIVFLAPNNPTCVLTYVRNLVTHTWTLWVNGTSPLPEIDKPIISDHANFILGEVDSEGVVIVGTIEDLEL